MSDKKLFFGVTSKEMEDKLRAQEKKRADEQAAKEETERKVEEAKRKQEEAQKRRDEAEYKKQLYTKYVGKYATNSFLKRWAIVGAKNVTSATLLFMLGSFLYLIVQAPTSTETSNPDVMASNEWFKPYKVALHDAYIPTHKYYGYQRNNNVNDIKVAENPKFHPHIAWCLNVLISLCVLITSIKRTKRSKDGCDAVDMMIDLKKFGKEYNLNTKQVKRLAEVAGSVIQKMSSSERVYFDMLMDNKINIANKDAMKQFATNIIIGHLEYYPSDAKKILEIFDEQSIPEAVLDKISHRTR